LIHIAYNLWVAFDELCLIFIGKNDKMKNEVHWVYIYGASKKLRKWLIDNKNRGKNENNDV